MEAALESVRLDIAELGDKSPFITAWNRFATLPLYRRFGILNREELAEERS